MPIISINDIGVKEDSAQRLIETVGIDDKYLLSADEINAIVEYCKNNTSIPLINTTTGNNTTSDIIVADALNPPVPATDLIATYIKKGEVWLYKTIAGATTALRILSTGFRFGVNLNKSLTVSAEAQTAQNTQTFQDKSGVIALTSDIPATIKVLAKKGTYGTSITGTVSETILEQFTIPAGELVNGNIVGIGTHFYTSGTNPFRYRISNTNSLAGAIQIAVTPNATNNWISMSRKLFVLNNGIEVYNSTYATYDDLEIAPGSYYNRTAITINLSLPIYVFITGALTSQYGNNKSVGYTAIKY